MKMKSGQPRFDTRWSSDFDADSFLSVTMLLFAMEVVLGFVVLGWFAEINTGLWLRKMCQDMGFVLRRTWKETSIP